MKANHRKINTIIICTLVLIVMIRAWFVFHNSRHELVGKYAKQVVEVEGIVSSEPLTKDFSKVFILKTSKINNAALDISIKVTTDRYTDYEYGQHLILKGKLLEPFNFKSNGGRVFDYVGYLLKDDVYFEMKKPEIKLLDANTNHANFISRNLFLLKSNFLSNLKRVMGEPHSALAGGLVVGDKSALGKELIDDFRRVGLIHIVVLSGYNITIVAESIRKILSFLPRNIGIVLGGLGILLFGILVGGGATVVRSCIMAIIALMATFLRRDYDVGRALFIAAMLMLIENPLILVYDPSFQLSFLATLGLILLSAPLEKKLGFITEILGLRALVATTIATQIFVSPYLLYMMGQLSTISVITNILILPIIPATMLFVTLTGLFGFVSTSISIFFGWISQVFLSYELFIVEKFANIPFAAIELPKFSFWIVIAVYSIYFVALTKFPRTFSQFIFKKKSST